MALPARVHTTVRFRDDNRAQSVQVGAILLFATLVIALSLYQATVVPSQNADIEYKHSQTVQNQMTDVRNGILRSAATGTTQPASVTLGTQYPSRVFLMNPPPSTGTLQTENYENGGIEISNVVATNDETADFIDGSWSNVTKHLEYEPNYHEYDNAPNLAYGETLLYNHYPRENTTIPLSDQLLVNGNTITLVALNGSMSTTQAGSVSVSPQALSGPYERVQVTNQSDGPVEITLPTQLSADTLTNRTGLGGQDAFQNAEAVGDDRVRITLDAGMYTLRTAKVGVGSGTVDPGARYLTTGDNRTVQIGEEFTVSVRDAFNNPVSGDVNVTVNRSVVGPQSKRVSEDGTATFTYNGTNGQFNASILGGDSDERRVVFKGQPATGGGGGVGDGDDTYDVTLEASDGESEKVVWNVTENGTSIDLISEVIANADPVVGATVDYAVNPSTATLSPSTGETNMSGKHTTTVDVPEEDGWEGTVFAASGDDVDTLPIRVNNPTNGGVGSGQTLQAVESEGVNTQSGQLRYTLQNTGSEQVTIETFSVDATIINQGIEINNGNNNEVEIDSNGDGTPEGSANAPGNGNSFEADGTTYDLQDEGGSYVDIGAEDDSVLVTFREFENGWIGDSETLEYASANDAEVVVTLGLSDGSEQTFYFSRP
jgi:hypothetical protein